MKKSVFILIILLLNLSCLYSQSDEISGEFTSPETIYLFFTLDTDEFIEEKKQKMNNFTIRFEDFNPVIGSGSMTMLDFDRDSYYKFNFFNLDEGYTREWGGVTLIGMKYLARTGSSIVPVTIYLNKTTMEFEKITIETSDRDQNMKMIQLFDKLIRTK